MGHSGVNMPVNANILAQFAQPVRSVNDYMADYERQDANKLAGQRNALMLMQAQQQMAEQQRQSQEKDRANAVLKNLLQQLPSPQQTANQQAFNASGAPLGTVAAAKAQPPVDPRQQIRYQLAQAGAISPTDYIDEAMPKQAAPSQKVVGGSLVEVGPTGGVRELYRAPEKPQAAPEIVRIMEFRDSLPQGDPRRSVLDAMITKSTTHAPGSQVNVNTGQKGLDNTLKLRGDFRGEPVYKAHQEMQSAYSQIQQSLKQANPIGDVAAATKIMKLLDPGSVVRESELGISMAATGMLDRVTNYAGNIINGTKLTPKQRIEFQSLADALYGESVSQYNNKRKEYQGIAERNGLNVPDVLGGESTQPKPAQPKPGTVMKFNAKGELVN